MPHWGLDPWLPLSVSIPRPSISGRGLASADRLIMRTLQRPPQFIDATVLSSFVSTASQLLSTLAVFRRVIVEERMLLKSWRWKEVAEKERSTMVVVHNLARCLEGVRATRVAGYASTFSDWRRSIDLWTTRRKLQHKFMMNPETKMLMRFMRCYQSVVFGMVELRWLRNCAK